MTEIFNNAYNQANQILDGSGLSSVIHKREGGSFSIKGLLEAPYNRALALMNQAKEAGKRYYQSLPSTAKFYLEQFQDKPMTDSKTLAKSEINELIKAIERNQASPKDDQTIPGPIYDENGNILFDPEGEVTGDTPGYSKIDYQSFSDLFPGDPLFNLQNTLGNFYYGPANLAGEREIYDVYDWEKGDERGLQGVLGMIAKTYNDLKGRKGRTISFTVNPYKDQWEFNPETGEHINPEDQGSSQQNTGEDHSLSSFEGYSEETSPSGVTTSFIDDAAIDTLSGLKHGGKITSGGLAGIKKSININGQPHKLAWINSDEASALKAMGGSGKKVEGIPAYFYIGEDESYEDVVVGPTGESPTEEDYMVGTESPQWEPDKSTGLVELTHQEIAKRWSEMLQEGMKKRDDDLLNPPVQDHMTDLLRDQPKRDLLFENLTRAKQKDIVRETAKDLNPDAYSSWDFENFAEKYPAWGPGGMFVKVLGWLSSLNENPVVSTVNIKGVTYNIHKDGTFKEREESEDNVYQGNYEEYPQKLKKLPQVKKDLTEPEEKEPTGMAALLAKRPEATSREYSNVYLGELLDQIYRGKGQSMLG